MGRRKSVLLVWDGDQYRARHVKGVGRYGSTNIYVQSADDVVKEVIDLPEEPDFER